MLWQDWVFGLGAIIFAAALIPSILGKNKPSLATSIPTGTILVVYAFTQASLSLWFAAVTSVLAAVLWFTLAVQKYKMK